VVVEYIWHLAVPTKPNDVFHIPLEPRLSTNNKDKNEKIAFPCCVCTVTVHAYAYVLYLMIQSRTGKIFVSPYPLPTCGFTGFVSLFCGHRLHMIVTITSDIQGCAVQRVCVCVCSGSEVEVSSPWHLAARGPCPPVIFKNCGPCHARKFEKRAARPGPRAAPGGPRA
jgi:hypothetical protein